MTRAREVEARQTRGYSGWIVLACLAMFVAMPPGPVLAQEVDAVVITGVRRTQEQTLLDLLPCRAPCALAEGAALELSRRVSNLGIFDRVAVTRRGSTLNVDVREKWTLIPSLDLSTGDTLADLYVALGATEYNVGGTATSVGLTVYRAQRGVGFQAEVAEHEQRRHRWSYGSKASYGAVGLRFENGSQWYDEGPTLMVSTLSPALHGDHFRLRAALWYSHERIVELEGPIRPPSGHALQPGLEVIWDGYQFHDLVPRGVRAYLGAGPGWFVPAGQARHWAEFESTAAFPLARYTVLTGRAVGAIKNRGNANHNYLMGSIAGVRGLPDSLYRDWVHAYVNVELRQSVPLLDRLALQLVAFADGGGFERLSAAGGRGEAGGAFSGGIGLRLIPTFLTKLLLRLDAARLVAPQRRWFWQLGVSQYF
jgi:hypothetical protein